MDRLTLRNMKIATALIAFFLLIYSKAPGGIQASQGKMKLAPT